MKIKSMFAALAASAVALSAMALTASAATVEYTDSFTLDGTEATAEKMWQYDLTNLAGNGTLTQVIMDVTTPFEATGWSGGGGAFGMNFGDKWFQTDFGPAEVAEGEIAPDNWTVTIDIPETYSDVAQSFEDGIVQIGWWWGAGDTLTVNKIQFVFVENEGDNNGGDTTTTAGGNTPATTTTKANTASAGDNKTSGTQTGDAGVGIAVAALSLAGAAAFVARKKN